MTFVVQKCLLILFQIRTNTMTNLLQDKGVRLFLFLTAFFMTNAIIAQFIGVKIFAFEDTVGMAPLNWNLFGHSGSLMLSAGVLPWPIVFVTTDIINEYYGKRGVKLLSYTGVFMIFFAFLIVFAVIQLEPADFWIASYQTQGVPDAQAAFATIFGQGAWMIVGSIIAFLLGQIIDAFVFDKLRRWTKDKMVWLRATGSTIISQFIDSFVVLYIAFVLGPAEWPISQFLAVGTVNYSYKFLVALSLTPIIYLAHSLIDRYLGKERAEMMRQEAIA